jgi:hypothetical protein
LTDPISVARPLDHVVVAVLDLSQAGDLWSALGFQVSPIMRHLALGSANRLVGFGSTYIELLGRIEDMIPPHRERWMARFAYGEGLTSFAFRSNDLVADYATLIENGVAMTGIGSARRVVDMPDGNTAETDSDFAYLDSTASPFPPPFLVMHKRPETIFIPAFAVHANTAIDIVGVTFLSADPDADRATFACLSAGPAPVEFLRDGEATSHFGAVAPPLARGVGYGIGLTIAVTSLAACRASIHPGVAVVESDGALLVPASAANGLFLRFIERKAP